MSLRVKRLADLPAGSWTQGVQQVRARERKYRNVPVVADGQRFDSKLEARCYQELMLRVFAGEVLWFIRQPTFHLAGVKYRADFLAVLATGGVEVIDAKGAPTQVSLNKIKQVKAMYGVSVILWPPRK